MNLRHAILCAFFLLFYVCSHAQQKHPAGPLVTVDIRNRPFPEALAIIEARVPVHFAYPPDLLHGQRTITFRATAMPLNEFLTALFAQTNLTYHVIGDQVVLHRAAGLSPI